MSKAVTLTIQREPPPSLNTYLRMHWADRQILHKTWRDEVAAAAINAGRPHLERAQVRIVLCYPQRRRPDPDNMAVAPKLILDGLRAAGVIPDDNIDHVVAVTIEAKQGDVPHVEIELRPARRRKTATSTFA